MNTRTVTNGLEILVIIVLAGLFLYAGSIKILNTSTFYQDILSYKILAPTLAWWLAHGLPWLEVLAGVALLFPRTRAPAALLFLLMMILFTLALMSAWIRGIDSTCGCFGSSSSTESNYLLWLARDLALIAGFLFLLKLDYSRNGAPNV